MLKFNLGCYTDIDVGASGHIVGGGDRELAESLFSHSLKNEWCFRNGFLCQEDSERRNDARSCPSHKPCLCSFPAGRNLSYTTPVFFQIKNKRRHKVTLAWKSKDNILSTKPRLISAQ